jgi:hypothetical protein
VDQKVSRLVAFSIVVAAVFKRHHFRIPVVFVANNITKIKLDDFSTENKKYED